MRPTLLVSFSACMMLGSGLLHASTDNHPLQPSAPRTVAVNEADAPPQVRTALLQSTLIVLPNEEKVANVFAGDTVNWAFDGGHVASRFVSVKPKAANAATDVHIVSDHGNEYTLALIEVASDSDPHFDTKVFLSPTDQSAKDRLIQLPVFVPVAELDKAKQDAATARTAQEEELKAEQGKAEQFRSQYPGTLHFDYEWDEHRAKELGLQEIWRDDRFTYLRGDFQETPALYELKDGKGSLINFDFNAGLYTVPKQLEHGYLAIGKEKLEFHREGGVK